MDPPPSDLAAAYAAGRAAHPGLRVDLGAWRGEVERRLDERLTSLELAPTSARRAEWLAHAAHADLFLTVACALRVPGAWERLAGDLTPRLTGLAHERGVRGVDAETLANDVLADFLLPGSKQDARPLLATYAGSGSLFGFAAVLLARREARRRRDPRVRKRVALATEPDLAPAAPGPSPAENAADAEVAARLSSALEAALVELTPKERLALVLKHRDGLAQREIAALLAVGEPRVSRLLASAVERLRAALVERLGEQPRVATGEGPWVRLRDVLAAHLARMDAATAPSSGGGSSEGSP